ncbi:12389_t:CDS:2, partial [Gigaspora margarita]
MRHSNITEESIGKISDKVFNIGIVGAGPSGIYALYELSKINYNQKIKVSLYESDPNNFTISGEYETAGLTWYYAGKVFGINKKVNPFLNPGAVTIEFVFGDRVDHYISSDWEDPDSLALKIKELVKNKLWEDDCKIGNRTPKDVSSSLKREDTLPQTLKDIHSDWKTFVTKYDGMTLGSAVHNIILDSIDKLPGISGLGSLAEKVNYYFELFGYFGFGIGPFKLVFNMSIVEIMRLLLWDYSSEYLFPVAENVDFINKLYKEVKNIKNKEVFDIENIHVKVCDIFHRMDEKLAGVAYYDLEKYETIPQEPATQIISSFGSTTIRIYYGEVGTPSIGLKKIYNDDDDKGILLSLMLSIKNGEEAANAQLIAAIDSLHMTLALDNRFFLASCSYSHLGGWLEGAFMSAINAVSGIVVAANNGFQRNTIRKENKSYGCSIVKHKYDIINELACDFYQPDIRSL